AKISIPQRTGCGCAQRCRPRGLAPGQSGSPASAPLSSPAWLVVTLALRCTNACLAKPSLGTPKDVGLARKGEIVIGGKHMRQAESHAATAWTELIEALNSTRDAAANKIATRRVDSSGWPLAGAFILGAGVGWAAAEVIRRRKDQIDRTMETVK